MKLLKLMAGAFYGIGNKMRNSSKLEALYLVDPAQGLVKRLPSNGKMTFTTRAERWEPGKIYVPAGAKIVSATSEAAAWVQVMQDDDSCIPGSAIVA